jgi:TRAP-type C4-dicarboxylate transport system substrate-binding protein
MKRTVLSMMLTAILSGILIGTASAATESPVTLRLGVSDDMFGPSMAGVVPFVDAVSRLSGGSVIVEPEYGAGNATTAGFEIGTGQRLLSGDLDLALVAGRAWHALGATGLDVLQAPFLIDSDALAAAVATDVLADDVLASLAEVEVTGLVMWPEDLRHPAAFESCIDPITRPGQLVGRDIRVPDSIMTTEMMTALGATPVKADEDFAARVASCQIQAAESGFQQGQSLPGPATFTGDVVFFPKYQLLAANNAVLAGLTEPQQEAVRRAAVEARDAMLADHPSEADAAEAWCAQGGRVVLAGDDGVAAFREALRPMLEQFRSDPVTGPTVAAIERLKETTEPGPLAVACNAAPIPTSMPVAGGAAIATLPPEGTYRATIPSDALIAVGVPAALAKDGAVQTLVIKDSTLTVTDPVGSCGADLQVRGDTVRLQWIRARGNCDGEDDIRWQLDGDQLSILPVPGQTSPEFATIFGSVPYTRLD